MPPEAAHLASKLWRIAASLAAGIATGALLVAGYIYGALGENLVFEGLFEVSLFYGVAIAGFCIPLWLMLARLGRDNALAAAALGLVATFVFVSLTYAAGSHDRVALMTYTALPYGLCGAAAALVTWWVGRRLGRG
jgi:hypothetical protein